MESSSKTQGQGSPQAHERPYCLIQRSCWVPVLEFSLWTVIYSPSVSNPLVSQPHLGSFTRCPEGVSTELIVSRCARSLFKHPHTLLIIVFLTTFVAFSVCRVSISTASDSANFVLAYYSTIVETYKKANVRSS